MVRAGPQAADPAGTFRIRRVEVIRRFPQEGGCRGIVAFKSKVNLIGGFLGSGKTTLLRHFLSARKLPEKVALLVNELGEVGIDGRTLARAGGKMVELANGCICCQVSEDLVTTLVAIFDGQKPDRILIESTGVAEPGKILSVLYMAEPLVERLRVDPTVIVVDAGAFDRFKTELAYHYVMQIKSADLILLNKIDRIDGRALNRVETEIQTLSPRAFIQRTDHCRVDLLGLLEGAPVNSRIEAEDDDHDHSADHFSSFVDRGPGVFDRGKLETFLSKLPASVFRAKGFVRAGGKPFLVNFTAGETEFESIPAAEFPGENQLVFIGRNLQKRRLLDALKKCKTKSKG